MRLEKRKTYVCICSITAGKVLRTLIKSLVCDTKFMETIRIKHLKTLY